jgi:hypothetical protein
VFEIVESFWSSIFTAPHLPGMTTTISPSPQAPTSADGAEQRADQHTTSSDALNITLLLISALRVSIRVDSQFLKVHEVGEVMAPNDITVGSFKDVLYSIWHENWGSPPINAAHIRLIHLGKVLEDNQTLEQCRIVPDGANVVHMSVKPKSFDVETPVKLQKKSMLRHRRGESGTRDESMNAQERRTRGGCCIIL